MATLDQGIAAQNILKEVYTDGLHNLVVARTETLDLFKQNSQVHEGPEGKYFKMADLLADPQGIGSRFEDGVLPIAVNPQYLNVTVNLAYTYAMIQTTWRALKNIEQGPAAFADFHEAYIEPAVRAHADDLDRQAVGYGNGALCRVDGAPSGTTVNIGASFGLGTASSTKGFLAGIRRGFSLVAGPNVDGSGLRGNGTPMLVTAFDPTGNSGRGALTVDALIPGLASGDYLWRGDAQGNNAPVNGSSPEMMGLYGLADDGTSVSSLFGVSRTTVPEFKANVTDLSASPYSGTVTQTALMKLGDDIALYGAGNMDFLITSRTLFRNVVNSFSTSFGGFGAKVDVEQGASIGAGRVKVLTADGRVVEIRTVNKWPVGTVIAGDRSVLHRFEMGAGEWDQSFGNSIFKQLQVGNAIKDAGYAYYRIAMALASNDPRKLAKGINASETAA